MTTVGLELTNFINPNLAWKTASKGTKKAKRSRRSVSKISKLVQYQAKRNIKHSSVTQSSESDKSDLSIEEGRLGNMECLPLKKRKFLLRSPSPPPQSPNNHEESKELDTGRCLLDPQTFANEDIDPMVTQTEISTVSVCEKHVLDGNVENAANSYDGPPVSNEDFSGILILAAAACSGELDSTVGDIGKNKIGGLLKQQSDESFPSEINMKEDIVISPSTDFPRKETGQLKDEGCVVGLPSNSIQSVCCENTNELVDKSLISELSRAEPSESVVCSIDRGKSIERCGLADAGNPIVQPNKGIDIDYKTTEHPSVQRDFRFHWDLNTVMDEWDHPIDDSFVDSSVQSVEVAQSSAPSFQKSENLDVSTPLERPLATESADRFSALPVASVVPESKALPDCGSFTCVITALNKSGCSSNVSSCFGIKENCSLDGANSLVIETTSNYAMESNTRKQSDQSLPLGLNGAENLVLDKGHDTSSFENLVKVAEENSASTLQTGVREIDFSLVPLSGNTFCKVEDVDTGHTIKNAEFLGADRCEFAAMGVSLGKVSSCKASDRDSVNPRPLQHLKSTGSNASESIKSHPLGYLAPSKVDLNKSDVLHRSIKLEAMVAVPEVVVAKQSEENLNTSDASRRDNPAGIELNVPEALKPDPTTENHGGRDSHISTEVASQVTESNANVDNSKGCYDSHLEDGELRESVGHFWEDNEGEDGDTEHVDYDSDNREGIFSEAAYDLNDSVELSGEGLGGDCVQQSCFLDKFTSVEPSLDKSMVENCSIKGDSMTLVACSGAQLEGENRQVEGDCKGRGKSDVEAGKPAKESDQDALRNCRGASASGRDLQFSDTNFDPIRRSRSCNFDGMHQTNASSESFARHQSSMQKDWVDRSWNVQLKSDVADSVPEDGERIVQVQEDIPSRVVRPRIISTSRSSYNPMKRGSPGDRELGYGMGMAKGRDFSPNNNNSNNNNTYNNSRNRFDRPFNGVNRGFREGYRRPGPMLNNFGKRERSFSPVENPHFPRGHRKSKSRSRSRSPDFRSEARMGRTRPPYQQHGHIADHIRERRSPARVFTNQKQRFNNNNMGSPGRFRSDDCMRPMTRPMRYHDNTSTSNNKDHDFVESDHYQRQPHFLRNNRRSRSRSPSCSPDFRVEAKMGGVRPPPYQPPTNHIRGRRSPVRPFRPTGQRFNNDGESSGRPRPDDCGRPMIRPGRFNGNSPHNNGSGDEYRRKPRNIFERIHPLRNDVDGDGRRFQCDEQDDDSGTHNNFRRNQNFTRGGGARRPVEGFRREERVNNVRYNNNNNNNNNNSDRMFYSGPKQFGGIRDYADDTLPRGTRP